jgi:adenylate cyclase
MSDPIPVSRRLVAVFAADVEGYSRLMGADEVGTLKGLTERRAILDRLIGDHRGRIANTAGDSVLAEFGSAVDAVQCAVEAQTALAEANSGVAPDKRINFRIGVRGFPTCLIPISPGCRRSLYSTVCASAISSTY